MTVLTLNRKELEKHIGKITKDIEEKINLFGTPIENLTEEEFSVDITANRPDLLSMQGFSRAISAFLGKKTGLKTYKVEKGEKDYRVIIDKSVKQVRPFTACAIVKGLKFTDEKIKEIIDIQEKLHGSYGRNRKKLAIGIYPLEEISLPIKFLARKPEEIKFQPLEFPKEINGRQILSQHPTGREYAHLLKDAEFFPIFEDNAGEILSMPPIINSHKTGKITENTRDIFIECSGFNQDFLNKTLNIIVTALSDMGGKIYSTEITDGTKKFLSPNLDSEEIPVSFNNINKLIGLNLSEHEIKKYLEKMGLSIEKSNCLIPPYRTDFLHEVDVAEDVAIAYGYENLEPEIPEISTIGEEDKVSVLKKRIADILSGLGLLEISTFHISTKEVQFKNIGVKEFLNDMIELIDSKTENNILRNSLLAGGIKILSENIDASYPQKIFELGRVFYNDSKSETSVGEKEKLLIALCHEKANFTEIKQILDYLSRMLQFAYEIKEGSHNAFIDGRCAEVIIKGKSAGFFGEINPFILKNNKIKMPVAAMEIAIENL